MPHTSSSLYDSLCFVAQFQLRLDVAEFGREAAHFGVDLSATDVYRRLLEVVEATTEESATAGG